MPRILGGCSGPLRIQVCRPSSSIRDPKRKLLLNGSLLDSGTELIHCQIKWQLRGIFARQNRTRQNRTSIVSSESQSVVELQNTACTE